MIKGLEAHEMAVLALDQIEEELGIRSSEPIVRRIIERWEKNGYVQQSPTERLLQLKEDFKNRKMSNKKIKEIFLMIDYILMEHTGGKL